MMGAGISTSRCLVGNARVEGEVVALLTRVVLSAYVAWRTLVWVELVRRGSWHRDT
jgi:hypothetical protein